MMLHRPVNPLRPRFAIELIAACAIAAGAGSTFANDSVPGPSLGLFSSAAGAQPPAPWRVVGVPRGKIPLTRFDITELDGRKVLRVEASRSYGNLVHALPAAVPDGGQRLRWRWRLDQPLAGADLRRREADDSPLKVCALFDMPLDRLGLIERNVLRLARSVSGEDLPSATLCYVWDATLAPGTLLPNAYSARVRMIVVDSGAQRLGQWTSHARDLAADFRLAFGHESASVPTLEAVLVGADADNTAGYSLGYVGDVTLTP
jgi:hypothetical protein